MIFSRRKFVVLARIFFVMFFLSKKNTIVNLGAIISTFASFGGKMDMIKFVVKFQVI